MRSRPARWRAPIRVLPFTTLSIVLATLGAGACGDSDSSTNSPHLNGGAGGSGGSGGSGADAGPDAPGQTPLALLEIYPLDVWAQFLPAAEMQLQVKIDGAPASVAGGPVLQVPLFGKGTVSIDLDAPEHVPLSVSLTYDGSSSTNGAALVPGGTEGQGLSLGHELRMIDGKQLPVHTAFLGLRHKWFSAQGRPARRGNAITLLMDGEKAWANVAKDMKAAKQSILAASWWWQSDFELIRDPQTHLTLTPTERWQNTILGILEASPAERRVLVGQFWGQDSILQFMTTDAKLKAYAEAPNDKFEFMGQANQTEGKFFFQPAPFVFGDRVRASFAETAAQTFDSETQIESNVPPRQVDLTEWPVGVQVQHASYHQKFSVIDGEIANIGGMNFKEVDWDTSQHLVYQPLRMLYGATAAERLAVKNKEALPDNGPRKDYVVRIEGPAAQDAAEIFQRRWDNQIKTGATYSQNSTPFQVKRDIAERPGGKQAQVTATLPQPFWEHAIAETWLNAVAEANDYIYIEDQYWRAPMLTEAIIKRMDAQPNLKLVVFTKPINEWTDPGCPWTYKTHAELKAKYPSRYALLQLRSFDYVVTWGIDETEGKFADHDVHSKVLLVDDKFVSIGSANKNNRGMVYEGELNVAILDPTWVREARREILANMLPPGTPATDDAETWWAQLLAAAKANDAAWAAWDAEGFDIDLNGAPLPAKYQPKGFVYSMDFGPYTDCFMESVGPDMTIY